MEVRHKDDPQDLETTEFQDPEVVARKILQALPQIAAMVPHTEVRAMLPADEGRSHLSQLGPFLV